MSESSLVQLGSCLNRASTWNPLRVSADHLFRYIDLSSVDQDNKAISDAREVACGEAPSRARQLVATGDVLVSTVRPNLNGVARVPSELDGATASTGFCVLRPEPKKLDSSYLFQWVKSSAFVSDMVSKATGASYPAVSDRIIFESEIPLPPLEEQRRIAAILDQAETLRTQRRQALAHLDTLTQSLFLDMFGDPVTNPNGWKLERLGSLSSKMGSGSTPLGGDAAYKSEGISLIRSLNVHDGAFKYKNLAHIDELQAAKLSNVQVAEDDVLLNITGASVARVCRTPANVLPARVNQHVMIIRPKSSLNCIFLERMLLSEAMKRALLQIGGAGATREAITKAQAAELLIPLPPLPLQQTFAIRIQAIESLKATHRAALAQLDALFASLQQRAFNGELTKPISTLATHRKVRDFSELCQLDTAKGVEALIYVARRMPGHDMYKSLKALYFGDKRHLEYHGALIYGETYSAMQHGPVPQFAYDLTKALEKGESDNLFASEELPAAIRLVDKQLIPARDADVSILTAEERASLDWAVHYCADMSFTQTKTASHDSAYDRTPADGTIRVEDIVQMLSEVAREKFFS